MSNRTYDWNGHTGLPISYPDLTDEQMAGTVRMLMRNDLCHEGIVCGARDRIMCLVKETAAKDAEIAKLREALELILPLAKGYAATNNVGNNGAYIAQAEAALEGGAS
ncbi:hypothetical protein [Rhizobium sp. 21-4511-3d]